MKKMIIAIIVTALLVGGIVWVMTADLNATPKASRPGSNSGFVPDISVRQYLKFQILSLFRDVSTPSNPDTILVTPPDGWEVRVDKRILKSGGAEGWAETTYTFKKKGEYGSVPSITMYRVPIGESNSLVDQARSFSSSFSPDELVMDENCTVGGYKGVCLRETNTEKRDTSFFAFVKVSETVGLYAHVLASSDPNEYKKTIDVLNQIASSATIDTKTEILGEGF